MCFGSGKHGSPANTKSYGPREAYLRRKPDPPAGRRRAPRWRCNAYPPPPPLNISSVAGMQANRLV